MRKIVLLALAATFLLTPLHCRALYFYVTTSSGHTLKYTILSEAGKTVSVAKGGMSTLSGMLEIPSTVTHDGTIYTVTAIESNAFYYCNSITKITIPSSITSIGGYAFENCTSLAEINIPSSVTSIGDHVFENCTSLTEINVDDANNTYASIDGVLYSKNKKNLIRVPPARGKNVTLGPNVAEAQKGALAGCQFDTLFLNASECVAYYGANESTRVRVLEVGEEVDSLYDAFVNLPGLQHINVSEDNWKYVSLDGLLMYNGGTTVRRCPVGREGDFVFPTGVTHVGNNAFENCTELTSLNLSPITYIGEKAFSGCTGLRTLTIPATVDTIWR